MALIAAQAEDHRTVHERQGDDGFMLLGAVVLIFLLLLAMTVAAPRIARGLQREREVESERRANEYVRAIRLYYRRFKHYPGSIEQLEKTNNQRFLRQRYVDPLTGKADWRLIHVGENLTKVKGFFGEDLAGLQSGLGSAASMASTTGITAAGANASTFSNPGLGSGSGAGAGAGAGAGTGTGAGLGSAGQAGGAAPGQGAAGAGLGGTTSQSVSDLSGTGGPIIGIGSAKSGKAMLVVNEQTTFQTWEFLYDPRIEQLYAKANLLGGGSSTFGGGLGAPLGTPVGTPPGAGTTPGAVTPAGAAGTALPPNGSGSPP